jgi:hypothetical protein
LRSTPLARLLVVSLAVLAATGPLLLTGQTSQAARSASKDAFGVPKWTDSIGSAVAYSSPTYATVDGVTAVVAAGLGGRVYAVNAATGKALTGWAGGRGAIMYPGEAPSAIESSPTVAYLSGPTKPPSIIVGVGSQSVPCQSGGVIAFNANGSTKFVFHTKATFQQWGGKCSTVHDNSVFSTVAVGPVVKGQEDIVFGSYDHYMYALSPSGKVLPGFPIYRADSIWSSPALVDYTHTGVDDIIEGGDSSGWGGPNDGPACHGGWIDDYRDEEGSARLIWEHCVGQTVWSSPAIGVITSHSTRFAVVVGTSWATEFSSNPATDELFAFYANGGQPIHGWPVKTKGPSFGSPVIAKLTPTSNPVVISTSCAACSSGPAVVAEWSGTGHQLWSTWVTPHFEMQASPVVANVVGGVDQNVLVGAATGLSILNGATGKLATSTPLEDGCSMFNSPVVFKDVSSPSRWELALSCNKLGAAHLVAYNLPAAPKQTPSWPQWRGDSAHDGFPSA